MFMNKKKKTKPIIQHESSTFYFKNFCIFYFKEDKKQKWPVQICLFSINKTNIR